MEILGLSVIQLMIQYFLYHLVSGLYLTGVIELYKLLRDYINNNNLVEYIAKFYTIVLITTNIFISLIVRYFTNAGKMAGMSNLFASCILGAIMLYDVRRFKLACKGKYH